jgi:ATP-dependent protease Clp ATPase subunit
MLLIPIAAITEEGVKGENMSDVVKKISVFARRNKKGIIILDEFDKVLQKNFDGEGENRSERVQAQLMQIFWSYVKI